MVEKAIASSGEVEVINHILDRRLALNTWARGPP